MSLFGFLRRPKPASSAETAKERLQILLAHERRDRSEMRLALGLGGGNRGGGPGLDRHRSQPRLTGLLGQGLFVQDGWFRPDFNAVGDRGYAQRRSPFRFRKPDAQKSKRWGTITPPLRERANERVVGEEDKPRRRRGWVGLVVLLLLVGGGVWLWRQGQLEPIIAPVRTLIAKVMPGTAPSAAVSQASAHVTTTAPATTSTASIVAAAQPAPDKAAMIQEIKQLLAKLDLGPGSIDGTLDPTTVDAIRSYQQMAGLPVNGQPSQELLQDLRAVVADQRPAGG
jgi:hypothetical protein